MLTKGIRGKLGGLVYRTRNGNTHCYHLNASKPNSKAQKASQVLFAKAVEMSQQDKLNLEYMKEVNRYAKRKNKRPFDVLMSRNLKKLREEDA